MQPDCIKPLQVESPAALMTAPSAPADESATLIPTPAILMEQSVTPVTTPTVSADGVADPHPSRGN